jgi:type II secretory pathway predicted ATPase ExeA
MVDNEEKDSFKFLSFPFFDIGFSQVSDIKMDLFESLEGVILVMILFVLEVEQILQVFGENGAESLILLRVDFLHIF